MKKLLLCILLLIAVTTSARSETPDFLGFTGLRSENGGVRGLFGLGLKVAGNESGRATLMSLARFDVGVNGQAFGEFGYAFQPIGGLLKHVTFMPLAGGGAIIDGSTDPIFYVGASVGLVVALGIDENTAVWVGVRNSEPVDPQASLSIPASFGAGVSFGI